MRGCTFQLQRFTTELEFTQDMLDFLAGQPSILDLTVHEVSRSRSPRYAGAYWPSIPATILPHLSTLQAPALLVEVLAENPRPITHMHIDTSFIHTFEEESALHAIKTFGGSLTSLCVYRQNEEDDIDCLLMSEVIRILGEVAPNLRFLFVNEWDQHASYLIYSSHLVIDYK
jgi:hypothetical protein